ncbi:MAG: alpha/beta hydrolase, partial [Lachnospiraceae bacterium]|nr:alpha/beta hydrolase [Lachnospiraceae bacterium]
MKNRPKRSFKYAFLLRICKLIHLQKVMEMPPEKIQRLFEKNNKGVVIPPLQDAGIRIKQKTVSGSSCLFYHHKGGSNRICIYLVGGGMLQYPKAKQVREVLGLAKETGRDFVLPYYPLVYTGHTLPDVYRMIYDLYKELLEAYSPENIAFLGSSSGANLALGMISYINDRGEGLPMPEKVYAGSPGSLLITEEEKKKAVLLDQTDVIMSQKATASVWEGMTGGKNVPDYMESLQLGDYTGLK